MTFLEARKTAGYLLTLLDASRRTNSQQRKEELQNIFWDTAMSLSDDGYDAVMFIINHELTLFEIDDHLAGGSLLMDSVDENGFYISPLRRD